jgi:hypothetical protein
LIQINGGGRSGRLDDQHFAGMAAWQPVPKDAPLPQALPARGGFDADALKLV